MSVTTQLLSVDQRRIWRTYRAANLVLAAVNGVYGAYAFLYLKRRMESAGGEGGSVLDNLLFVIIASMFFEFFAEPITGDWADAFGRRRMVVSTYFGVGLAFLAYWVISSDAVSDLDASTEVRVIVALSLAAEVFYAVASALFNGALDAWFVDELKLAKGPQGAALLPFFAAQRRISGVFMVGGGVLALWFADTTFHAGDAKHAVAAVAAPINDGLFSPAALPWLLTTAVVAAMAVWLGFSMQEHRVPERGTEPSHLRIWKRLRRTLRVRELRNALLVSSVLYTCWICFMFLLPVLLTEKSVASQAGPLQLVLKHYYWFYLAMGTTRFLGPYLSGRLWSASGPMEKFRAWGVINCGALALAGAVLLSRAWEPASVTAILVPVAVALFWVAKLGEEAFKPVRSTYLNCLVTDGSDRAFVLSMATPFGAVIIVVGVALLAGAQQLFHALDDVALSVPLLFAILGTLGVGMTIKLSRAQATRPSDEGVK